MKAQSGAMSHDDLVSRAARWLRKVKRCSVVVTEITTSSRETPDALGWWGGHSLLVECKATRADFRADRQKTFRMYPESGIGEMRWYMTPPGLLKPEELPEGWGLLEAHPTQVREIVPPQGWTRGCNAREEVRILLSVLRRERGEYTLPVKKTTIHVSPADSADPEQIPPAPPEATHAR